MGNSPRECVTVRCHGFSNFRGKGDRGLRRRTEALDNEVRFALGWLLKGELRQEDAYAYPAYRRAATQVTPSSSIAPHSPQ